MRWEEILQARHLFDEFEFFDSVEEHLQSSPLAKVSLLSNSPNNHSVKDICARIETVHGSPIGDHTVLGEVVSGILAASSNQEAELVELLGLENLEIVAALLQQRQSLALREEKAISPNIYRKAQKERPLDLTGRISLPIGTVRDDNSHYERFTVPADSGGASLFPYHIRPVPVSEVSSFSRVAFSDYEAFNAMQSAVFKTVYCTNENLLVCAPTGAGKTDIAALAICKVVEDNCQKLKGRLDSSAFKIVYIAPMKALVAEIVRKFTGKLGKLGIVIRECTGDTSLTKRELESCTVIVSTPEKWDVLTRNPSNAESLLHRVSLLIIDEVHLLNDARGPVIESIVARTHRQVEITQRMLRIVGLSATLPNYVDVARFLAVNPDRGLFYFDSSFRPVSLEQNLAGFKARSQKQLQEAMNDYAYRVAITTAMNGRQMLLFVHSRGETSKTARSILQRLREEGMIECFTNSARAIESEKLQLRRSKNSELRELVPHAIGIHHAGLPRADRELVEQLFLSGSISLLVCTATLAWGVNLPAHTVLIRGTNIFDAARGAFGDLGILDVLQIFGRAGRPQFEKSGQVHLLTEHSKLYHYVSLLISQSPIESQFSSLLADNLNAEIALGNVSNISEAFSWLRYTYLYLRMRKNPMVYGISNSVIEKDPQLCQHCTNILTVSARELRRIGMISFEEKTGVLRPKELGKIASSHYVNMATTEQFSHSLRPHLSESDLLDIICKANEFESGLRVRDTEIRDLEKLSRSFSVIPTQTTKWDIDAKVNALVQVFIGRGVESVEDFSLQGNLNYLEQNFSRLARALFEMARDRNYLETAIAALNICISFERQCWWSIETPWLQMSPSILNKESVDLIGERTFYEVRSLAAAEISKWSRTNSNTKRIQSAAARYPLVTVTTNAQPISDSILSISLQLHPDFEWHQPIHGASQHYWICIADFEKPLSDDSALAWATTTVLPTSGGEVQLKIHLPEKRPPAMFVRVFSDRWTQCNTSASISLSSIFFPKEISTTSDLLPLPSLETKVLRDEIVEGFLPFKKFNAIQTQLFHRLYHRTENIFIGSSAGSGKATAALIAALGSLRIECENLNRLVIFVCTVPEKLLLRFLEWKSMLEPIGIRVELVGDNNVCDFRIISLANIAFVSADRMEVLSRSSQIFGKVLRRLSLIIIDDVHFVNQVPQLESLIIRLPPAVRIVALGFPIGNSQDVSLWLNAEIFNFSPSVRSVPLQVHLETVTESSHSTRQFQMNKNCFNAITLHASQKPSIIFAVSNQQVFLTGQALTSLVINSDCPRRFVGISVMLQEVIKSISDPIMKDTLQFGVGLLHSDLSKNDQKIVEELFHSGAFLVLVCTSSFSFGLRLRCKLVVVKEAQARRPICGTFEECTVSHILQMMSIAGRPQIDDCGVAVVLLMEQQRSFYKHFLQNPIILESSFLSVIDDFLKTQIINGISLEDSTKALEGSFLAKRLRSNPSFYKISSLEEFLKPKTSAISSFSLDRISEIAIKSGVKQSSLSEVVRRIADSPSGENFEIFLLSCLSGADEFSLLSTTHKEWQSLELFGKSLPKCYQSLVASFSPLASASKAILILIGHYERMRISNKNTRSFVVLTAIKILNAVIEAPICSTARLSAILLLQRTYQAIPVGGSPFMSLPTTKSFPFSLRDAIINFHRQYSTQIPFLSKLPIAIPVVAVENPADLQVLRLRCQLENCYESKITAPYTPRLENAPLVAHSFFLLVYSDQTLLSIGRFCVFPSSSTTLEVPRGCASRILVMPECYFGVDASLFITPAVPSP